MIFHFVLQGLFFLTGMLLLLVACFNWEWFFATENSRQFLQLYDSMRHLFRRKKVREIRSAASSRRALRWIYGLGGMLLIGIACYFFHLTRVAFGV